MGELEFAAVAATKPSVQETIKSGQIEENPAARRNECQRKRVVALVQLFLHCGYAVMLSRLADKDTNKYLAIIDYVWRNTLK